MADFEAVVDVLVPKFSEELLEKAKRRKTVI